MCVSTPDIPTVPERQAMKLPDNGLPGDARKRGRWRAAIMAGLVTSPQGVLGSPNIATPTLGGGTSGRWYGGANLGGPRT
jgi:hypothetical protein